MGKHKTAVRVWSVMIAFCCLCGSGYAQDLGGGWQADSTLQIRFNGEDIAAEPAAILGGDACFVPMRVVFETMGAVVFYRERDKRILALSRDGDIVCHAIGSNVVVVNGTQTDLSAPSVIKNGVTYVPVDLVSGALCTDRIVYDAQQSVLDIQKYVFHSTYHEIIKEILEACRNDSFRPENFQSYISYQVKRPDLAVWDIIYRVNLGLDVPFYTNAEAIAHPYELLVLVNKYHQLPAGFSQYHLVDMHGAYYIHDGKQYQMAGAAYGRFVQMAEAARLAGLSIRAVSAYRSEGYQAGLYNANVRRTGAASADRYSARPGFSEHQTGLAVDINSTSGSFENTDEFRWLQDHAHEFGYIMRYPRGKEWVTGYAYEPWHYRYVGTGAAQVMHEEALIFEEYYVKYVDVNEYMTNAASRNELEQ